MCERLSVFVYIRPEHQKDVFHLENVNEWMNGMHWIFETGTLTFCYFKATSSFPTLWVHLGVHLKFKCLLLGTELVTKRALNTLFALIPWSWALLLYVTGYNFICRHDCKDNAYNSWISHIYRQALLPLSSRELFECKFVFMGILPQKFVSSF